jgi:hypothetical protein
MPLKKLLLKPGVNRENTRYTTEGGWYESDKIRFRQGTPEKLGGWQPVTTTTFQGVCRSLWNWATLGGLDLISLGTNLKFYILSGVIYYDITPIRTTRALTNPFVATASSSTLTVTDTAHGGLTGDFVTFSGAVGLGGNVTAAVLNSEYRITVLDANTYTVTLSVVANATDASGSPGGGASVSAAYQISVGPDDQRVLTGWGAGGWGYGTWGDGQGALSTLRIWSQDNFGEDLIFAPRGGPIYYWPATGIGTSRGVSLSGLLGASDVPVVQNYIFVSDVSRFVFAFGCNDYGSVTQDSMLIRWSDQESATNWTPDATTQAGSVRLSRGSEIVTCLQTRQEIVTWTDSAVYSLQYVGAPAVWSTTLIGDNISIISQNSASLGSGVVYWMGVDKFYKYDGRVQTLRCDLRQFIFGDINLQQSQQVFSGTNEGFNEIWWFYCSAGSTTIDRYVIYNYTELNDEGVWYYGSMSRTAWIDSGINNFPIATTYNPATETGRTINHESGVDDNIDGNPIAMNSLISSSEFDIDDGDHFGFVWRIVPDVTFRGSTGAVTPQVTMTLIPMQNSGSGANNPISSGGNSSATIQRIATVPIEEFTGQVYVRVRGRQMILQVDCNTLGTQWQLGAPRIDIKQDGRRGNS